MQPSMAHGEAKRRRSMTNLPRFDIKHFGCKAALRNILEVLHTTFDHPYINSLSSNSS